MIDVLNRGIIGEEAPQELTRMRADVIAEAPVLTIWQVGTNAVWQRGHNLDEVAPAIEQACGRRTDADGYRADGPAIRTGAAHRRQD
jgi:hypothetical protein